MAASDDRWENSNSCGANIICVCCKPWKNSSVAAVDPAEARMRGRLCPQATAPSHLQASTTSCWVSTLIPIYTSQSSRSSKASVLQFSPCSLGSSAIFLPFLCQESPRPSLASTSHLQAGKITFSYTLWRSPESRGQCVYTGTTSDWFWNYAFSGLTHTNFSH